MNEGVEQPLATNSHYSALCFVHCTLQCIDQSTMHLQLATTLMHCALHITNCKNCPMTVKSGKNASSSRSEVSLFNPGVISLAEMKPNGGWIWSSLVEKVVKLPPAGGVRGQWAAAMAWIHLHTHWIHWIHLHTHTDHHLKTLTTFRAFYPENHTLHVLRYNMVQLTTCAVTLSCNTLCMD